jgi:hypothetical protein
VHPFFDVDKYPWDRPDARELYNALWRAIPHPDRIDVMYRASGSGLPPLALRDPPDCIWTHVLDALASARRLKGFLERLLEQPSLEAISETVQRIIDAPAVMPINPVAVSKAMQPKVFDSLRRAREALPSIVDKTFVPERLVRRVIVRPPNADLETEEVPRSVAPKDCTEVVRMLVTDTPTEFKRMKVQRI